MSLKSRIEAIKELDILDVIAVVASGEDVPEFYNEFVRCLLPDHEDRTPSFKVDAEGFFKCFGCQAGGDVISFTQSYLTMGVIDAVDYLEQVLGISGGVGSIIARAKSAHVGTQRTDTHAMWRGMLRDIENSTVDLLVPYLRCRDWLVVQICQAHLDYVLEEISNERLHTPVTARGGREQIRRVGRFARGMASYIEMEVERVTGKDRLDVAIDSLR